MSDVLNDRISDIKLIEYTPIDNMPVYAARISYAADHKAGDDPVKDEKLMTFLAAHKHLTPFEHQVATFRVHAPLFVFREWHRHRTQSYNELSRRYTSANVEFYLPAKWRAQSTTNKQGSGQNSEYQELAREQALEVYRASLSAYELLLEVGIAKEQARMVLPQAMYTTMYATANARNWDAFCKLRCSPDAQWEIRQYANAIDAELEKVWPTSWKVLKNAR
jgi:thymidylate synthase (FAD)